MSHTQKFKTHFVDLECLKKALLSFGWGVKVNSTARTYPSDPAKGTVYDYVAVNPRSNGYDIGLIVRDNSIDTYGDLFDRSIVKDFGEDFCKLKKEYAKAVFVSEWESQGFFITETIDQDGGITLEANQIV